MKFYMLDTNMVSHIIRQNPKAVTRLLNIVQWLKFMVNSKHRQKALVKI